jgi:TonB-linked SusC/RagA family outer membrane protein
MRNNYLLAAGLCLAMCCTIAAIPAFAQVSVSGTVRDENAAPLPGVNIIVKGSSVGTITDTNGTFQISVPDNNTTLVFSFIGYSEQEVSVNGRSTIDINMALDVKALDEVVVTALGIERSSKSLGYATSKVSAEQISTNRTPNWMNGLTGKIAGVAVTSLGTGPGGTSKVRIRGQSSINGQNNPLLVVNGVPIDNTNFSTNPGNLGNNEGAVGNRGGGATSDGGDALSSINPDDIESMTILKGAAASALYGSRAKDGVIMIVTKSKGASRGIGITYNMNYTNETPLDFTDYQYEYGQGEYGIRPTTPNPTSGQWSFGERIQPGMTQTLFNTPNIPYEAQRGIIRDFYRNGSNLTNSLALSASNEKGGMNLSVASTKANGITPNNTFDRKTVNLGFAYDLSSRISFRGNVNYSNEFNENPPVVSEQDNSIPTSLFAMANTMPLDVMEANKYNPGGGEYTWSRFTNRVNPYWALEEQVQRIRRDRIFGNLSMKFDVTKWLSVQGRVGQDFYARDWDIVNLPTGKASLASGSINAALPGFVNGVYTQEARRYRETNIDLLVTAAKTFGDFGVNANLGGNQMRKRFDVNSVQVTDFVVKDLYTVQNGRAKDPTYDMQQRGVNSLYGSAEVNFKQFIYLTGTLRQDWFSTLSPANRTVRYPSISASYVFSETFKPGFLNFGKLRLAYAETGSDTDVAPYSNVLFYGVNANLFGGQPVGNFGAIIPNANLQPMKAKETEIGVDMKMFNNRVALDLAAYHKLTINQIINAQVSDASGFTSTRINSGESYNRGIEMMLNLVPVKTADLQWDFTFAGSYNITKVLSLLTDVEGSSITVGNHVFNGSVQHIVGKEMGQIVGYGYRRDDGSVNPDHAGMIVYGTNGIPLPTTSQIPFGSALSKWVGGFTNAFNYKGVMLSVLIDFKLGGKMLSGTNFNAWRHGLHKATLVGRDNQPIVGGVQEVGGIVVGEGVNQSSQINTVGARVEDYYSVVRGSALIEPVIYNAGFWKLRQITLGYDFSRFLTKTPIRGLSLNLVASNVLILKKWVDNIDPESYTYSSDNLVGMESPGLPTTRSTGFNLNVKF